MSDYAEKILTAYAEGFTLGHISRALRTDTGTVAGVIRRAREAGDPRAARKFTDDEAAARIRAHASYNARWNRKGRIYEAWVLDQEAVEPWTLDEVEAPRPVAEGDA